MLKDTLEHLAAKLPDKKFVWGGDWNQNLTGRWQSVGCGNGAELIKQWAQQRKLQIPTANLPHQRDGLYAIDHIAVPEPWSILSAMRVQAADLSDHDAYIVEVDSQADRELN